MNLTPENLELEERITTLLRSAEMLATAVKASAEAEAVEILAGARADAALLLEDAEAEREDARSVLLEARRRANDILDEAAKRAERATRIQKLFVDRLRGARDEVDELVAMLDSIDDRALVDLTTRHGVVQGTAYQPFPRREHLVPRGEVDPEEDQVTDMVRAAVGRAIEQSRVDNAHA